MWTCGKCSERLDDQFDACWKCGNEREEGVPSASKMDNPSADAPPPVAEDEEEHQAAPAISPPRPRRSRLLAGFLALTAGVGIGYLLPRISINSASSPIAKKPQCKGIRVEELKSEEEVLRLVHEGAIALKYSGGDVEFRVEVEKGGQTQVVFHGPFSDSRPAADQSIKGCLVWVRDKTDDANQEHWKMTAARRLVSASEESITARASLPMIEGETRLSKGQSLTEGCTIHRSCIAAWETRPPQEKPETAKGDKLRLMPGMLTSVSTTIPIPLPTDKEVCLMSIKETRTIEEKPDETRVIRIMVKAVAEGKKDVSTRSK